MTNQTKIFLTIAALLLSFAFGRYSNQQPEVSDQTAIEKIDQKQTEQEDHTTTVIIHTKDPSGTEKTVTTINNNIDTKTKDTDKTTIEETKTVTPQKQNLWNVSAMAGVSVNDFVPVYGAQVSKQVLGPISVGAFGFTSGLFGVSVGVSF